MSSLTVTLLQSALHWEDKAANLAMWEEKLAALGDDAELVILPEMFSTGFSMNPALLAEPMDGGTMAWMQRMAARHRIVLTGSFIAAENGNYYNRLVWMLPNGQYGTYDKRHLFAYAGEDQHYTPGNKRLIASVKGWRVCLLICYDLRFPVWARNQLSDAGQPEYDLLVYVANWPERRNLAWKTLLQARAIENQCFVAGVNRVGKDGKDLYYSGDTMLIDAMGEVLYHNAHDEDVFTYTLQKETLSEVREKLPFWKDGDDFLITPLPGDE
jgi:predicted amidohydrolase